MKLTLSKNQKHLGIMLSEVVFPNIACLLRNNGYDFLIIDCEHGCFDYSAAAQMIAMARSCDICPVVRIPEVRREPILKYLDAGAGGLLVPMIQNADQVRQVVEWARYAPLGKRGVSTMRAHTGYCSANLQEYMADANENVVLLIQAELRQAVENIDEIAAVPGINGLMVGPSDLSMDLGIFGQNTHPALEQAMADIARAAGANGLLCGLVSSDIAFLRRWAEEGMRLLCCDSELGILNKGLQNNSKKLFE